MIINGSCHCGNISFELDWGGTPEQIPGRACDCTFCVKHGGLWTSSPTGFLTVTVESEDAHSKYAMGTGTADFHVCTKCGVVPVVTSEIEGRLYAVVSVNAFNNVDSGLIQRAPASFGEESSDSRLGRRQKNWIRHVEVLTAA